mgnify:CR=1 FL=1
MENEFEGLGALRVVFVDEDQFEDEVEPQEKENEDKEDNDVEDKGEVRVRMNLRRGKRTAR